MDAWHLGTNFGAMEAKNGDNAELNQATIGLEQESRKNWDDLGCTIWLFNIAMENHHL